MGVAVDVGLRPIAGGLPALRERRVLFVHRDVIGESLLNAVVGGFNELEIGLIAAANERLFDLVGGRVGIELAADHGVNSLAGLLFGGKQCILFGIPVFELVGRKRLFGIEGDFPAAALRVEFLPVVGFDFG